MVLVALDVSKSMIKLLPLALIKPSKQVIWSEKAIINRLVLVKMSKNQLKYINERKGVCS
jgi:hypothetical protein